MIRAAAMLSWLNGLGFGIPCLIAIQALSAGRGIPFILGFPAYGRGPFQRFGVETTIPLLVGFAVVCLVEVVAGALLWNGSRGGAVLALAVLPAGAVYWWGFALPFGPVIAILRTVLIVLGWRALT